MNFRKNRAAVPVIMLHSIGIRNENWVWASMSESLEVFETLLARLQRRGYRTVGLSSLYEHMAGRHVLPPNSIVLTFDDGYLDNWVFVAPLLRKFGMTGVVYVAPEFVQVSDTCRPTLDDVWAGRIKVEDLETIGFMNWDELRMLDQEGTLDVQCHGLTHTWYFSDCKVIDFHRPREVYPYPWLSWNARPDRKPWYLNEDQQHFVAWGSPVFKHEKSLITRRFFPDSSCVEEVASFVHHRGGRRFFDDAMWKQELISTFEFLDKSAGFPGTFETEEQYAARLEFELRESKRQLEINLEKKVEFLSWPGGGVNDLGVRLAEHVGFRSYTLSSWQQPAARNEPGANPSAIKRVAGRSKVHWRGKWIANGGSWWIMQRILQHQGSLLSVFNTTVTKLFWILGIGRQGRSR
jgi:hypothetical protein